MFRKVGHPEACLFGLAVPPREILIFLTPLDPILTELQRRPLAMNISNFWPSCLPFHSHNLPRSSNTRHIPQASNHGYKKKAVSSLLRIGIEKEWKRDREVRVARDMHGALHMDVEAQKFAFFFFFGYLFFCGSFSFLTAKQLAMTTLKHPSQLLDWPVQTCFSPYGGSPKTE